MSTRSSSSASGRIKTVSAQHQSPIQAASPGTTQSVSISGTSAASSNTIGSRLVRLVSTTDVHVVFAASPTATTSDMLLIANQAEYFVCDPSDKVAGIQNSASGTLYVTACEEES